MHKLTIIEEHYNNLLIDFNKFSVMFLLLQIFVALWNWKYIGKPLKVYFYYTLMVVFIHLLEHIHIWVVMNYDPYWEFMKSVNIGDTTFFNIFYRITIFYFLGKFYEMLFDTQMGLITRKISVISISIVILIFCFIDGYNQYGTINAIVTRIFSIVIAGLYLKQVFFKAPNLNLWKNPYFLISQSLIISNVLSMLFALIAEEIHYTNFVMYAQLSIGRNIINIVTELLVAYAFYQARYVKFLK